METELLMMPGGNLALVYKGTIKIIRIYNLFVVYENEKTCKEKTN